MNTITTKDGTTLFFKDWGPKHGPVVSFGHGWPLTADAWDAQMLHLSGYKSAFDCIAAFSETDFTEDLKKIQVPTLILHGDDDQVVPIDATAKLTHQSVKGSVLKVYRGGSHALGDTSRDQLNSDLLGFLKT